MTDRPHLALAGAAVALFTTTQSYAPDEPAPGQWIFGPILRDLAAGQLACVCLPDMSALCCRKNPKPMVVWLCLSDLHPVFLLYPPDLVALPDLQHLSIW